VDPYSAIHATQRDDHEVGPALLGWAEQQDWEGLYRGVVDALSREGLLEFARLIRKPSIEAAELFKRRSIDIVHIDGNHDADRVAADFDTYLPLVRAGGFVILDDISWRSVRPVYEYLRQSARLVYQRLMQEGSGGVVDDFAVFQLPPV
jgi:hypothetical protein